MALHKRHVSLPERTNQGADEQEKQAPSTGYLRELEKELRQLLDAGDRDAVVAPLRRRP